MYQQEQDRWWLLGRSETALTSCRIHTALCLPSELQDPCSLADRVAILAGAVFFTEILSCALDYLPSYLEPAVFGAIPTKEQGQQHKGHTRGYVVK